MRNALIRCTFVAGLLTCLAVRPASAGSWVTNSPLNTPRYNHSATLLADGQLLVVGGTSSPLSPVYLSSAELFDPATGTWTPTGPLNHARANHTATLLLNGRVLVVGGGDSTTNFLSSAEVYDPLTGTWSVTGPMTFSRSEHTATLLPNGKVLVAGGGPSGSFAAATSETYDPATGTWSSYQFMTIAHWDHTATLLPNGKVLVAGGFNYVGNNPVSTVRCELYDPDTGFWSTTGPLNIARQSHTATLLANGKVLAASGSGTNEYTGSAEVYDPTAGTWTPTTSLPFGRALHTASLLPDGKVLVTGGQGSNGILASAELYDPTFGTWTTNGAPAMSIQRVGHTTTMMPNGEALVAGGFAYFGSGGMSAYTELFDDTVNLLTGGWTTTNSLNIARLEHTATLLPNGKVLVAAGEGSSNGALTNAEVFDPDIGSWTPTGGLNQARYVHTATLLPNGKVLAAGGIVGFSPQSSAELFDPGTGSWTNTGSLNTARYLHTATLLPNGKVLVAGGQFSLSSAELWDPATGNWTYTGPMNSIRWAHTATLLPNGKVLVAGGQSGLYASNILSSAELYDPATGTWTLTGAMSTNHAFHTATLLPSGKVLVAGSSSLATDTEVFDPLTSLWTLTGPLNNVHYRHTATLLPNGKVLVAGGQNPSPSSAVELYDPVSGMWTQTYSLNAPRYTHSATLLPNGNVLVAGGENSVTIASAEVYDTGLGFNSSWQPQIASVTSPLSIGGGLVLSGSGFRGISSASGGNSTQDSASDHPVVQLRSLESVRTVFLQTTNWSTNSFTSLPVSGLPPGYTLATVFVNGIPSSSALLDISVPVPTPPVLTNPKKLANGAFQFAFTNSPGALFAALSSTDITVPATNWTVLGTVSEVSPGQFLFTDSTATNAVENFYRVRSQ